MKCFRMGPEHATNKIVVRTCNGIEVGSGYHRPSTFITWCIWMYYETFSYYIKRWGRVVTTSTQAGLSGKAHLTWPSSTAGNQPGWWDDFQMISMTRRLRMMVMLLVTVMVMIVNTADTRYRTPEVQRRRCSPDHQQYTDLHRTPR